MIRTAEQSCGAIIVASRTLLRAALRVCAGCWFGCGGWCRGWGRLSSSSIGTRAFVTCFRAAPCHSCPMTIAFGLATRPVWGSPGAANARSSSAVIARRRSPTCRPSKCSHGIGFDPCDISAAKHFSVALVTPTAGSPRVLQEPILLTPFNAIATSTHCMPTLLTTGYLIVDATAQTEKVRIDIHRHIERLLASNVRLHFVFATHPGRPTPPPIWVGITLAQSSPWEGLAIALRRKVLLGITFATFVQVVPFFGEAPSFHLTVKSLHIATFATLCGSSTFGEATHNLLHRNFEAIRLGKHGI